MKKLLLTLTCVLAITTTAQAQDNKDMEIAGKVKSIDTDKNIFIVETVESIPYTFAVIPTTDFEYEDRIFDNATFQDVEEGVWVKVEYHPGEKIHTADEVKIHE